ncbi:MAG: hypothetical protein MZW92_68130 [Comamonadaceae bacterium]|nr:hypothetical protein [Comamonadaceae bacterium]
MDVAINASTGDDFVLVPEGAGDARRAAPALLDVARRASTRGCSTACARR